MQETLAVVVLAAGKGTRMRSPLPKLLHPIGNAPLIHHVLDTAKALQPEHSIVVLSPDMKAVSDAVMSHSPGVVVAEQVTQKGTGDAVKQTRDVLQNFSGDVVVLYGDVPFLSTDTVHQMQTRLHESDDTGLVVLGFSPDNPAAYGRLVMGQGNILDAIVEYKDATEEQRKIKLCNSGIMLVKGGYLFDWLDQLSNHNASGEYYLTDVVAIARKQGVSCATVEANPEEVMGINSQAERAAAEACFQRRRRAELMEKGVMLVAPETVFFSYDTQIGAGSVIHPNVVFGVGVTLAENVEVKAFSHIEGAVVSANATIGPFARLRPGAVVKENVRVGNFVEIKNATLEPGAKVNHLSYVGDATVGAEANIGAGTITCNYDGVNKHHTEIGAGAFIGSNSSLVAPVTVGAGATIGAGSTVTKDVEAGALMYNHMPQQQKQPGSLNKKEKQG